MNLSDFLTSEADALEREFRDVTAPDRTPRSIRRVRAVRHGATAGVSVVAMGALVAGGVRLATWEQEEPAGVPGEDGTVTIDTADVSGFDPFATVPVCGAPAPAPTGRVEGLEYLGRDNPEVVLNPVARDVSGTVRGTIVNTREDSPTVARSDVGLVWVQDGVVVAISMSPFNTHPQMNYTFDRVISGRSINVYGYLTAETYRCDSPLEGPWVTVEAGAYDVYPVTRIVSSPESVGWAALQGEGSVATPGLGAPFGYYPGSRDCLAQSANMLMYPEPGQELPRECQVGPDDPTSPNTFTVDYLGRNFPAAFDVTLVGDPLRVTVNTSWQEAKLVNEASQDATGLPELIECGTVFDPNAFARWGRLGLGADVDPLNLPGIGDEVWVNGAVTQAVSPVTVTLPDTITLWGGSIEDDESVVTGKMTISPMGNRQLNFRSNGWGEGLGASVVSIEVCPGASEPYFWHIDTTAQWTDINGTVEIEYPPR